MLANRLYFTGLCLAPPSLNWEEGIFWVFLEPWDGAEVSSTPLNFALLSV